MGATAAIATFVANTSTRDFPPDYDDVLSMMPAHPSAVILPAMLASLHGQRVHGRAFIEAYVLGVEVGAKIGLGMTTGHYHRGFHATGTLTVFSALAGLSKLHRLQPAILPRGGSAGRQVCAVDFYRCRGTPAGNRLAL